MNIKKHIPNFLTCCNLLCGCLAIVQAFEGNLVYSAYLVGLAAIFDFFDGFAARMLKVSSAIGKDLDSLADMVTFGVVPGVMMFHLIYLSQISIGHPDLLFYGISKGSSFVNEKKGFVPICYFGFLITIFSCIRLAKFNNDTRQTDSFIGVPTPAVAIFICSIPLIIKYNPSLGSLFITNNSLLVLCLLSFILSLLLISELPLFALKFKHFKWKDNEMRFVFLAMSLLLLITLQFVGIPLIIIMYILLSILSNFKAKT